MTRKGGDLFAILFLGATFALVVALVGIGGDYPLNDDWAYAYSARHLLKTGELRILDWAAPSLLTHALWGAAALRLLGDSAVSLRCGTLCFAWLALFSLYGLARRAAFPPFAAVVATLLLGLSPWFVNLSFTYMTDVPFLAMMLLALLVFSHALRPGPARPLLLFLCGALLGAAALTRQFAIITTPAFAVALLLDARSRHGPRWKAAAAWDGVALFLPVFLLYAPFQFWYSHVHGPTLANRETFQRMGEVRPWHVLVNGLSVLHYAGLWLFPLALSLLLRGRFAEVVTRRTVCRGLPVVGGFAVIVPLAFFILDHVYAKNLHRPDSALQPLMPYLGNITYLAGVGPPTLTDVYYGQAPLTHPAPLLGVLLTLMSTVGALFAAGIAATAWDRARGTATESGALPIDEERRKRHGVLVLLCTFGGIYLVWLLCTGTFCFDRYLLPFLPVVVLVGVDAVPADIIKSRAVVLCLVLCGLCSVAGTREYLSWNGAREKAVRDLHAQGVPDGDVDGGFEVNGPRHFQSFLKQTGKLVSGDDDFWVKQAPYRISFWPARAPGCTTLGRFPYWTWPGGGDPAIYVVHCPR
jgi:4-amino-4-deoxy-L-arabinose transferase-like glycosyltransferase